MNERVKAPKGVESVLLPLNLMFALLCWFAGFDGEGTGRKVLAWTLFISTVTSLSILVDLVSGWGIIFSRCTTGKKDRSASGGNILR